MAAFLVARSCGETVTEVSQDEAIAIAKEEVAFEPNNVMVRLLKQGLQSKPFWAVSLSVKQPDGALDPLAVVVRRRDDGRGDRNPPSGAVTAWSFPT